MQGEVILAQLLEDSHFLSVHIFNQIRLEEEVDLEGRLGRLKFQEASEPLVAWSLFKAWRGASKFVVTCMQLRKDIPMAMATFSTC